MQFGTNHLGHFALTGLLLGQLARSGAGRVVTVASIMHRPGYIHLDDLQLEKSYGKWPAYCQSKLANVLFMGELQRKISAAQLPVISVACHPGYAATNLQYVGPQQEGSSFDLFASRIGNNVIAQSAAMGALPTLYAATAPEVQGGEYFGPRGPVEMWGYPKRARLSARGRDQKMAAALWEKSEELTKIRYAFASRAA